MCIKRQRQAWHVTSAPSVRKKANPQHTCTTVEQGKSQSTNDRCLAFPFPHTGSTSHSLAQSKNFQGPQVLYNAECFLPSFSLLCQGFLHVLSITLIRSDWTQQCIDFHLHHTLLEMKVFLYCSNCQSVSDSTTAISRINYCNIQLRQKHVERYLWLRSSIDNGSLSKLLPMRHSLTNTFTTYLWYKSHPWQLKSRY